MHRTSLSIEGYYYITAGDDDGPGSVVVEDSAGDTLLPPHEGRYTILEEAESLADAERIASVWASQR